MVTRGKDGGRMGEGIVRESWDGHGHTAVFNMESQQGPTGRLRELCSILCDNLLLTRGRMGEGTVRESGMDRDTRLCLTWRTSKYLLHSPRKSAHCHVAAWLGGEIGGEWKPVYDGEPFHCLPKTNTSFL